MRTTLALSLLVAGLAVAAFGQSEPNAARLSKYILTVSDVDKTYAFYHALGVNLDGATEIRKPASNPGVQTMTGTPSTSFFRNANAKIPGTDFVFEFIEFTGLDRTARHPRVQDPGAAMLTLEVRDIDAAVAAAKSAGGQVITLGGAPLTHNAKSKTRSVLVSDPDGFFIEILQSDPLPQTTAPADSNILGARFASTVEDAEKSARFYHEKFGFETSVTPWLSDASVMQFSGLKSGEMRMARITIPGTTLTRELLEYRGVDRKPVEFKVGDPGSLQLGFQVHDFDAAVAALQSAGGSIASAGGVPVKRPNGNIAIIRDPEGVYLEMVNAPKK
jgi:catechol 2,3-dioxygenase-like lactoylglutathione lyase family enzyme